MKNKFFYTLSKSIGLLALCFLSFQLQAQTTTVLQGTVKDAITSEPLIGASIFVKGTNTGTISNTDGDFSLIIRSDLPLVITISYTGYKTKDLDVAEATREINIRLEAGISFESEVVVSASRRQEKVQEAPAAVSVIESRQIETDITANPYMSLRNLTGVDVTQNGVASGHINLRGRVTAFQTETFVIADYRNITLPSLGTIQYGQQPIDAVDLDRIEVVKGPGGALYGPGVEAGVVHFISKSPFKEQGTTVSIGGGNQSQYQIAVRHAGLALDKKLGYKVTGFYRSAREFEVDTTDAQQVARLAAYPRAVVSGLTGDTISTDIIDYDIRNAALNLNLEYKFSERTSLIANAGVGQNQGLFRAAQGDGYIKAPRPYAQLRFQSGNFFAQTFWSKQMGDDGRSWLYASGRTVINIITQLEGQMQYTLNLAKDKLNIVTGADYRLNVIDTKGTLNGRYEEEDDYSIYGAYAQAKYIISPKVDLIGAIRVDRFTALDATSLSPRLALVMKPLENHTVRLTWNKAVGAPQSLNLHGDFAAANRGAFLVWANAGMLPLTYNNQSTYSFITQSNFDGLNFPLRAVYGAATQGIAASGALPQGLVNYLSSQIPAITGATGGTMMNSAGQPMTPISRGALKLSETNMYEIGYKGFIKDRLSVTVDAYYNSRKNNLTPITVTSPLVGYSTAGADLAAVIATTLSADSLAQWGLTPQAVAAIYQNATNSFTKNADGSLRALGLVSSDQSPTGKTLDASFLALDAISYFGLDLGVKYYLSNVFAVFANASFLNQTYWADAKVIGTDVTTPFSLNLPGTRLRLGAEYLPEEGISANFAVRYNSAWRSENGDWTGDVEASTLVDFGLGYAFTSGLKLNATAANVLNAKYQPIAGATSVGRLLLAKLTYKF